MLTALARHAAARSGRRGRLTNGRQLRPDKSTAPARAPKSLRPSRSRPAFPPRRPGRADVSPPSGNSSDPASISAMPAPSAIARPASRQGAFCPSTLMVTPPLKNSSVPAGSIDSRGTPSSRRLAPIHSGLHFGQPHSPGDQRQFIGRDDRQLPLVAHHRAALVPGLAAAGLARIARHESRPRSRRSRATAHPPLASRSGRRAPHRCRRRVAVSLRPGRISGSPSSRGCRSSMLLSSIV